MAPSIIREWCNVEIELQSLLCEVNLNVEYAFSQTTLRGHIDLTVKSKWVSESEEEGREEKHEEKRGSSTEGKAKR